MDRLPENFTVGRDDVADTAVFQQQALSEVDINSNWKLNILMQNAYFQEKSLKVLRVRNLEGSVNDSFTEIGIMRNLELLWINYTSLSVIPESICLLTNLQELNLSTNKIEAITTSVGDLTDLQELVLSFNNIKQIPPSIGNLANLQKLILLENQIINIPSSIGNLKYLELLSLPYNQIKSIPSTIGNLINLERLYLNSNRLEHVPASIGNLTNLKRLILSQNKITEIPSSIGDMKNLVDLDFSENKLKSIPESIGNLHRLKTLILYKNMITVLPETVCNLDNEVNLSLFDNPLQNPPFEICNWGIKAIIAYFEGMKKKSEEIYSKKLKLIPVGESGAERKIKDLGYNEIGKISKLLDPEMVVGFNWRKLASHFGFSATEINTFARSYCGGGNPALHFFKKLKTSNLPRGNESIRFLIESCRNLPRIDVVRFIETQIKVNLPENAIIHDIHQSLLKELTEMLTETSSDIPCWKNLADIYGFSYDDINQISTSIKHLHSLSPTRALFEKIRISSIGEKPISFLIYILRKMDRNDVIKLFEIFS